AKTERAYQFGNLPDSLVNLEKDLQKKKSNLQAALLEKQNSTKTDSLQSVLNALNQEIESFTKELKAAYPRYMAIRYESKIAEAKDIQNLLDKNTAILEYVMGDSVVYIFYLDKTNIKLMETYISNKELTSRIKNLHQILSNYTVSDNHSEAAFKNFTT